MTSRSTASAGADIGALATTLLGRTGRASFLAAPPLPRGRWPGRPEPGCCQPLAWPREPCHRLGRLAAGRRWGLARCCEEDGAGEREVELRGEGAAAGLCC
uniref:Uncharacterized protein n=1 Tax=Setaria italica TaxID=4555 RepID=K3YX12_SETIT